MHSVVLYNRCYFHLIRAWANTGDTGENTPFVSRAKGKMLAFHAGGRQNGYAHQK